MANQRGRPRIIVGFHCGHTAGESTCYHEREAHKFDEIDGSSWCDECWSDEDAGLNEIAYHAFEEGAFVRV